MDKQGNLSQIPHSLQNASPDPCQLEQMAESKSKEELIRAMRDVAWSENFMPEGNLTFTTLFHNKNIQEAKTSWTGLCRWGEATGYRLASGTGPLVAISWYFFGVIELMGILAFALSWLVKLQVCQGVFMLHMDHSRSATFWNSVARCEGERGWMTPGWWEVGRSFHISWSSCFSLSGMRGKLECLVGYI